MSSILESDIATIIVAAGASKRLGQPKQLLSYKSSTLLNHTIQQCWESNKGHVYVVLGSNYHQIYPTLDVSKCTVLRHDNWREGMGSSIAFGVGSINSKNYKGVIITMADQPHISSTLLSDIIVKVQKESPLIIISKYRKDQGPPVYFRKDFFNELELISGDDGAKSVVKKYSSQATTVSFEMGFVDIDEQEDLRWLNASL